MQGEGPENSIFGYFSSIELVSSKTEKQSDKVNEILGKKRNYSIINKSKKETKVIYLLGKITA